MSLFDLNPLNWLKASSESGVETITATGAEVTLQAASEGESKSRSFTSVAYSGGLMHLPKRFRHPAVVDLATFSMSSKQTPVFREHDPNRVIGHAQVTNDGRQLTADGRVLSANSHGQEVIEAAADGFAWQQSIGAMFSAAQIRFVPPGEMLQANGQTFQGPVYFIQHARLKEISFVALGADEETSAALAASAHYPKEEEMKFEEWLKANGWDMESLTQPQLTSLRAAWKAGEEDADNGDDSKTKTPTKKQTADDQQLQASAGSDGASTDGLLEMRADRVRMRKIETLCAKYSDVEEITLDDGKKVDPMAHAIEAGWQEKDLEVHLLRASYPKAPAGHVHSGLEGDKLTEAMGIALLQATGYGDERLEKEYSDQQLQAAHTKFRGNMGLQEMLLEAAQANGYHGRRNFNANMQEILQAAFSSNDISGILSNTANKYIRVGFEAVESTWRRVAAIGQTKDFKEFTTHSLVGDLTYEQVGPTGEIKHGNLGEVSYSNKVDTFAKLLSIPRTDLINDDLKALSTAPRRLGRGAALKICLVFWPEFMSNAAFFTEARNNYAEGASTALGVDGLTAAELLFLDQVDPDGNPLGVMPKILLVPNALKVTGDLLYSSLEIRTNAAAKTPTQNPHGGKYEVVHSSYLGNASITGNSTKAWYLLADPEEMPVIEIAFLNGKEMPTIEQSAVAFDHLGIQMRGYHDFGVRKQEYRGGVKMKGEA